jgi:hypothetical protein
MAQTLVRLGMEFRAARSAYIQNPTSANLSPRPQFRPQLVKAAIAPQHGEVAMGQRQSRPSKTFMHRTVITLPIQPLSELPQKSVPQHAGSLPMLRAVRSHISLND